MTHQDIPTPILDDVGWVHETVPVLLTDIGELVRARVVLLKQVDVGALKEGRVRLQTVPVAANLTDVLCVEAGVIQVLEHMFVARWRRLAAHPVGCIVADPRAIRQQDLV